MYYDELIDLVTKEKRELMPAIMKLIKENQLPDHTKVELDEFEDWENEVDGKRGLEQAPDADVVKKFAESLEKHKGLFNEEDQRRIDEFSTHAGQLVKAAEDPLS